MALDTYLVEHGLPSLAVAECYDRRDDAAPTDRAEQLRAQSQELLSHLLGAVRIRGSHAARGGAASSSSERDGNFSMVDDDAPRPPAGYEDVVWTSERPDPASHEDFPTLSAGLRAQAEKSSQPSVFPRMAQPLPHLHLPVH